MASPRPPANPLNDHSRDASRATLARALERRNQLDQQQRAIRDAIPRPHFARPRPPR